LSNRVKSCNATRGYVNPGTWSVSFASTPAPARDPSAWVSEIDGSEAINLQAEPAGIDPLAHPEPEYIFDQRIAC